MYKLLKYLICIGWLLFYSSSFALAVSPAFICNVVSSSEFDCTPYASICQHLEGSGFDNGESWDITTYIGGGTADADYTTNVLEGTQSLRMYDGGADGWAEVYFSAQSDGATCGLHLMFKVLSGTPSSITRIIYINDDATVAGAIRIDTSGYLTIQHGTASVQTGTVVVTGGSIYHIWVEWHKNTGGSNGTMYLSILQSSDPSATKPGSPDISVENGDSAVVGINRFRLYLEHDTDIVYDRILIDDSAIGDIP